jgi:hypothetical protein
MDIEKLFALEISWRSKWEEALSKWSRFTRLKDPVFCFEKKDEEKEGLADSFAMIRLDDHSVVISLRIIVEYHLEEFAVEILSHEIGHHVYCPGDLGDYAGLIVRARRSLPGVEYYAPFIMNFYEDLLINDSLFRDNGLRLDKIYCRLVAGSDDKLWNFYMRIYEILWSLPKKTLTSMEISQIMEGDAVLGNRLIRNYSKDWINGAGRFAALCYPYLNEMKEKPQKGYVIVMDTLNPSDGTAIPGGLINIDEGEIEGARHPSLDDDKNSKPKKNSKTGNKKGNHREPFEYKEILKNIGINLNEQELARRYYKEKALPYLIPFPRKKNNISDYTLPEGLDVWDIGAPIEDLNWLESSIRSPVIIPGVTTFERVYGEEAGSLPRLDPIDLDLYVDSSGSMPNPCVNLSFLTLAGTIIALSALRSGSKVQATLWSGKNEFLMTNGFVRNENQILDILTGYFGGSTAFPIHLLRKTYEARKKNDRKVHILVISDDGVTTMFDKDESGKSGWDISETSLKNAGGGGTLVLNLFSDWHQNKDIVRAEKLGYNIEPITDWTELLGFAKSFAKKHYGGEKT